jgi:hypothetical protein
VGAPQYFPTHMHTAWLPSVHDLIIVGCKVQ